MITSYQTIKREGKGEFKDRGSKFIGLAFPVSTRKEADEIVHQVKKEYYDARHHCAGLVVGKASEEYFASDDGEPSHSAGDPILGQIKSRELTNVVVVVVRYFGGTKLGVPGLINAYRSAADIALTDAGVLQVEITFSFKISFPYTSTPFVEKFIHTYTLKYIQQDFTEICNASFEGKIDQKEAIFQDLDTMEQRQQIINFTEIQD